MPSRKQGDKQIVWGWVKCDVFLLITLPNQLGIQDINSRYEVTKNRKEVTCNCKKEM